MPTQVKCPSCSTVLQLPDSVPPGGAIRCSKCKTVLRMPSKAAAPSPAKAATVPHVQSAPAAKPVAKPPMPPPIPPAAIRVPRSQPRAEKVGGDRIAAASPARKKFSSKKALLIGVLSAVGVLLLVCGGTIYGVVRLLSKGVQHVQQSLNEAVAQIEKIEKKKLDVSYIPADCKAALVLRPARLAKSSFFAADERDAIVAKSIQEDGIDLTKVDQFVVVMELLPPPPAGQMEQQPPPAGGPPVPVTGAAIAHFTEPVDGMAILGQALKQMEPKQAGDKTYQRSKTQKDNGSPLAGHFDGQRTVLIGPEPMIVKMLAAKDVMSPLRDKLREFELENDLFGVVLMEPFKPMLKAMSQAPEQDIPPQLEQARKLHQTLSAVKVLGNLDGDKMLQLTLLGEDDASGVSLEDLSRNALDMGKAFYPLVKKQLQPAMQIMVPPQAGAKIFKITDQILKKDGITVTREGKNVVVTLNRPKDLP